MATAPKTTEAPKKEDAAPEARTFAFTMSTSVPIPDVITSSRSTELPFKAEFFTPGFPLALSGQQPHMFVPHAYWIEERKADAEKVDSTYARGKLNDQFKKWRDADEGRKAVKLLLVNRTGKEGIEGISEAGISCWLQKVSA